MSKYSLTIECIKRETLGRCYEAFTYKIVSFRMLKLSQLKALSSVGVLGVGQTRVFSFITEENKHIVVPSDDDWRVNANIKPTWFDGDCPYYEYECIVNCDSSD